jgi:hypothetical protein
MSISVPEDKRRAASQLSFRRRASAMNPTQLIQEAKRLDALLWQCDDKVGPIEKSEIAQTLRTMYDLMEEHLMRAPKDSRYLPIVPGVTWQPNDPLAGIPMVIEPFMMYEWWGTYIQKVKRTPQVTRYSFENSETIRVPLPAKPKPQKPRLSDEEKRKLAKDYWKKKYGLRGKAAEIFDGALDILGHAANAAEIAAEVLAVLGTSAAAAASGTAGLVFVVQGFIQFYRADKFGVTLYQFVGCSYAVTAWAFNDKVPKQSTKYLGNLDQKWRVAEFHKGWAKATTKALDDMKKLATKKKVKEEHLKVIYRLLHDDSRQKLFATVLATFESQLDDKRESIREILRRLRSSYTYPA